MNNNDNNGKDEAVDEVPAPVPIPVASGLEEASLASKDQTKQKANRYHNGKIYKLVSNSDDKIYVGSTCMSLAKRKADHKTNSKKMSERHVYKHFNEIKWNNVDIILIEQFKCENKMELERRERYWIETLKPELNKNIPTRTDREYYEDNRDAILENKKAYYVDNKEIIKERDRAYYAAKKDIILAYVTAKIKCEICDVEVSRSHKSRHERSLKHKALMEQLAAQQQTA